MKTAFIIHGSDGNPNENWFPWLKGELERIGYTVFVPKFPCENEHELSAWLSTFKEYEQYITPETIIIAHSRGCSFAWRVLETGNFKVAGLYLVGGFYKYLWYPKSNGKTDTFFVEPFKWEIIKEACKVIKCYQSDNDEWVPINIGNEIGGLLNISVTLVKDAGHFNTESGYTTFPLLLDDIKSNSK